MKIDITTTLDATDLTLPSLASIVDGIKGAGAHRHLRMRLGKTEGLGAVKQVAYGAIVGETMETREAVDALQAHGWARIEILKNIDLLDMQAEKLFSNALSDELKIEDVMHLLEGHRQVLAAMREYFRGEEMAEEVAKSIEENPAFR